VGYGFTRTIILHHTSNRDKYGNERHILKRLKGRLLITLLYIRYSIRYILREVWHCLWLFIIVFMILGTPVWLGYGLYFIFKIKWAFYMATTYLMFWNVVPFTPYIAICITITLIIERIFKR